ncbi:hypothetical protein CLV63_114151 [Murinocardiopsis flavida]|uniref:site-specific DNA-methyltransferase (adenine-specific) n=1 Tax=Murinocardiopsis flavida TaxID=645275 RepID=A0A2P8DEU5_9ACTN|nr:restriction endonuclease [Murinocardiopsis flavida]PSK95718.1 hypothetical protein CLV63_114151 [Murinocardiopsis flavida]
MSFESLVNRGDYFSPHYLAEVMPRDLKAQKKERDKARAEGRPVPDPRAGLTAFRQRFFAARPQLAEGAAKYNADDGVGPDTERETWVRALRLHHRHLLAALGFTAFDEDAEPPVDPVELTVAQAGAEHAVPVAFAETAGGAGVVAVECGWASTVDEAFDTLDAGRLLDRVHLDSAKDVKDGASLATFLFGAEDPPRYVLLLAGGVVVLADRTLWGEGRYLAVSLNTAFDRNDTAPGGEMELVAALFGAASLRPPAEGGAAPLADLVAKSNQHAVGVSDTLRDGLRRSVEVIANEVLDRMRAQGVRPEDIDRPDELGRDLARESLRYLYRVLFLLYAEARPDLGILPADAPEYAEGYGLAGLGDLVDLAGPNLLGDRSRESLYLYESLDLLFRMVNEGHRPRGGAAVAEDASEDEGLRFEPLESELFRPSSIRLIGAAVPNPSYERNAAEGVEQPRTIDTRLRNVALHRVLRNLMLAKGSKRGERGGFISYAQLGINQLGAVYEGLMSYTGFIAAEELYEVAKGRDPKDGSWMVPASKAGEYERYLVQHTDEETGARTARRYPAGTFVYRLAGRDRQTSASYYTPESLTKVTVEQALRYRLYDKGKPEEGVPEVPAADLLRWKICEPALGSGAFLNEAINQVAAEYLRRRQGELGTVIPPDEFPTELQKAKAYIALHNSFGVDLNSTAAELAEVSLWLNVMHPGLQAPWFGLHLRRGNSLIGAKRSVYAGAELAKGRWLKTKDTLVPTDLPFRDGALPEGAVHHFLLPAQGWAAVAGEKEAKELAPVQNAALKNWRKDIQKPPAAKRKQGQKLTQVQRLQGVARRAEYLWTLVQKRLELTEAATGRRVDVWGADDLAAPPEGMTQQQREQLLEEFRAPGTPYWRLKLVMDAWCALWFWPLDKVDLLNGKAAAYQEPDKTKAAVVAQQKGRRRRVIALKELDDWIDFTEATLGAGDLAAETLAPQFTDLDALAEHEDQLTVWMLMDSYSRLEERFPWLTVVQEIANQQGFFHWEVEFAQVFGSEAGGFDLQVGNPPWVRPDWDESAHLAEFEPWFQLTEKAANSEKVERREQVLGAPGALEYVTHERASTAATRDFLSSPQMYPPLGGTQPDLYRAFMCTTWSGMSTAGAVGLVHPDTHFSGVRESELRAQSYSHLRMHADFHNGGNRFFPPPVGHPSHFGVHVYGVSKEIEFDHLSWLWSTEALRNSFDNDGTGTTPGVKFQGHWDERPHRARIIRVDRETLALWQKVTGEDDRPVEHARLLSPVSTDEAEALEALAQAPARLERLQPQISGGFHELGAKKDGLIDYGWHSSSDWSEVVLRGPHIGLATPFYKSPTEEGKTSRATDLNALADGGVPDSEYLRQVDWRSYEDAQDRWLDHRTWTELCADPEQRDEARRIHAERAGVLQGEVTDEQIEKVLAERARRPYSTFYRLAWRRMIAPNTERALYAALIPPGPVHIHLVHSLALPSHRETVLTAGFWSALPLDYYLRAVGRSDLQVADAKIMPAGLPDHPLASALLLRTLRLNALTNAYAPLWAELFESEWRFEEWAIGWPGLPPLSVVGPEWERSTPLRTDRARRAALVEIDALVSVWLGISADALEAMYRARFPVLEGYESETWFDADGHKIAKSHNAFGEKQFATGQAKEVWAQLSSHPDFYDPDSPQANVPEGFTGPMYKADRIREMREAHHVFSERLERANPSA